MHQKGILILHPTMLSAIYLPGLNEILQFIECSFDWPSFHAATSDAETAIRP